MNAPVIGADSLCLSDRGVKTANRQTGRVQIEGGRDGSPSLFLVPQPNRVQVVGKVRLTQSPHRDRISTLMHDLSMQNLSAWRSSARTVSTEDSRQEVVAMAVRARESSDWLAVTGALSVYGGGDAYG
jgi:hypothetical protein